MFDAVVRLKAAVNKVYFNKRQLLDEDLLTSRKISIPEGCTARTIVTICSGPFLAGLVKYLGANDQVNGIIGAVPTLAGIIMLFSPMVLERLIRRKFLITFFAFFSRILLSLMFCIPLLLKNSFFSLGLLIVMFLAANLLVAFITPAASNWIISITPDNIRGRYFGMRESFVLGFVTIAALGLGRVLDFYKKAGRESTGFFVVFGAALLLAAVNFILMSMIDEPDVKLKPQKMVLRDLFVLPMESKLFRKVILIFVFWNAGYQFSAPFAAVYMVSGLKLDYTFITISAFVASAASVAGARLLGRLADKKSWLVLMLVCVSLQAGSQILWFFVNRQTALVLVPFSQLLGGAALGGVNITLSNIQYLYAPEERKTVYIGFSSAIGGLTGFVSSLLGAALVGGTKIMLLRPAGFEISGMQLVFGVSGLILTGCMVLTLFIGNSLYIEKNSG